MAWLVQSIGNMVSGAFYFGKSAPVEDESYCPDENQSYDVCDNEPQKIAVFDSRAATIEPGVEGLKKIYAETLQACQTEGYLNGNGEYVKLPKIEDIRMVVCAPNQRSIVYKGQHQTVFKIEQEDALTLACQFKESSHHIGLLVMSNRVDPFSAVEKGYQSQEPNIGRRSCLVPVLKQLQYPRPLSSAVFINLPVFRDNENRFMEKPVEMKCVVSSVYDFGSSKAGDKIHFGFQEDASVRAMPADTFMGQLAVGNKTDEYTENTKKSISTQLEIFAKEGCEHLVLGAIGCGAGGNPPSIIAGFFKEVITTQFPGCFKSITFAILDDELSESMKAFGALCEEMNQVVYPVEEDRHSLEEFLAALSIGEQTNEGQSVGVAEQWMGEESGPSNLEFPS